MRTNPQCGPFSNNQTLPRTWQVQVRVHRVSNNPGRLVCAMLDLEKIPSADATDALAVAITHLSATRR